MITFEEFEIVLNELAVREGSVFAIKIQARTYDGHLRTVNSDYAKQEHRRLMKLKHQFALEQDETEKQNALADLANRLWDEGRKEKK